MTLQHIPHDSQSCATAFIAEQHPVLCIATREEPGEHDQSFNRPGHHCRCPWLRPGRHPGCSEETKPIQTGAASWYGPGFHGKRTANGETFNTHALTAAHKTLPFGTKVRVTNERTGK